MKVYYAHKPIEKITYKKIFDPEERFNEKDIILISYGDFLRGEDRSPLATLAKFCDAHLEVTINILHILPFFLIPATGDSITDFERGP